MFVYEGKAFHVFYQICFTERDGDGRHFLLYPCRHLVCRRRFRRGGARRAESCDRILQPAERRRADGGHRRRDAFFPLAIVRQKRAFGDFFRDGHSRFRACGRLYRRRTFLQRLDRADARRRRGYFCDDGDLFKNDPLLLIIFYHE